MDRPRRKLRNRTRLAFPLLAGLLIVALAGRGESAPAAQSHASQDHTGASQRATYLGAHSMLYLTTPFRAKQRLFARAATMGASEIRLDIELSAVFPGWRAIARSPLTAVGPLLQARSSKPLSTSQAPAQWAAVNQYMSLARRYHLHVLADLLATPEYMADCPRHTPRRQSYRCPPKSPRQWGHDAGQIAAHTKGVIKDFEIINEPDTRLSFLGTPQQYGAVLSASYRAIHAANPGARVVLGGLAHIGSWGRHWMDKVLATPGMHTRPTFDVANIHVRVAPSQAGGVVCGWRAYFAARRFNGPLWVTETGYPADPLEQTDPGYQDGAPAQARWLASVIPAMLRAGAGKVFVTERDWGRGRFASEGVFNTPSPLTADPWFRRRPSFYTVQRYADEGRTAMMSDYLHSPAGRTTSQTWGGAGC